jgi:hypothetical protein
MRNLPLYGSLALAIVLTLDAGLSSAQPKGPASGIVCWKNKAGKTVGCGDKVPPEYQDNAQQELNKRGMTVKQTDAALTAEQRQAQAAEAEQKKAEAAKRTEEKRRDRALLDSFTTEKEIDLKRSRDIQQIEVNISAQQTNLKNTSDRLNEIKTKIDQLTRLKKPVPDQLNDDQARFETEKTRIQAQILQKRKEIVERNQEYDDMKKRFLELKGVAPAAAPAPAAVAASPAKK